MNWLEVIELRTAECNRELLEAQLQKLIQEVVRETGDRRIKVYRQVTLNTDFSIHLYHVSKNVESSGSPLGLGLASSLKEFGLVNHSVWIDQTGV